MILKKGFVKKDKTMDEKEDMEMDHEDMLGKMKEKMVEMMEMMDKMTLKK